MTAAIGPQPTLYIPHGGGPSFFMEWTRGPADTWDRMGQFLRGLLASLPERPRALLVVSAHWEEKAFTVNAAARPPLLFDYHGFPDHTYQLRYPAPGEPTLALEVRRLLACAGLVSAETRERGYDHGVFIPCLLLAPEADIPIVQLSLCASLDPAEHIRVGRALGRLRDEGVLIIGSGMSYHNLALPYAQRRLPSREFDDWLTGAVTAPLASERNDLLAAWASAPSARNAHPREEHLLPLMVAAGAAGSSAGRKIFGEEVGGTTFVSAFQFG